MASNRRVDLRGILANPDLRRELMVPTLQAIQAREDIETTRKQAERAYYVVTEGERATFFDLERFRGGKQSESDRREEMFVRAMHDTVEPVRFDVARRDFETIAGSPLAYRRVGLVSHIFRDWPPLDQMWGIIQRGAPTGEDERLVRYYWEVDSVPPRNDRLWEPFSKGGSYSRFYFDVSLRVAWDPSRNSFHDWYGRKGRPIERPESLENFFLPSLVWPRRTQRGFNLRVANRAIFSDKSGFIQCFNRSDEFFLLGALNSSVVEYLLGGLVSFGSFEVGAVKRTPVPRPSAGTRKVVEETSRSIHDAESSWDESNEICTRFRVPWLLREDLVNMASSISTRLDCLAEHEANEEARIQQLYAELNDEVYKLYGIPDSTRAVIEETLGERPPEVLWPQMEGKSIEQKRLEHVFRLLSYAVKRVVEADNDGVVPFTSVAGELSLLDQVHNEIAVLFPGQDVNQVEVEITNELKKSVRGYRRTNSIREWLENALFEYHVSLYKNRPILWHIASTQGTMSFAFGALVHYHKFDKNRVAKLRAQYLRDAIEHFRREAGLAGKAGRGEERLDWQARVEEAQELDRKLQGIQEGQHEGAEGGERDFRILTPWKSPDKRTKGWDPDLDDGVKVNIEPLQKASVLRVGKVV